MKQFFFAIAFLSSALCYSQTDRKIGAILIGNGTYDSPNFKTLSQSDDGVRIMKQLLADLNISSDLLAQATDNMTVSQMLVEIKSKRDIFKSRKVTDIIFYYTGHGSVMAESGESFFVPGNFREDSLQQLYSAYGGINNWVLQFLKRATKPGGSDFNPALTGLLRDFNLTQHTLPLSVVCNELKEFNLLVLSDACRDTLPDISKGASLLTMISDDALNSWIKKESSLNSAGRQKFVNEIKDFINYVNQKNTDFNKSVSNFKNTMSLLSVRKPVTVLYGTTYYSKAFENPDVIGGVFTAAFEQAVRNSKNLSLRFDNDFPSEIGKYITSSKGQVPYIEGAQNFEIFNPFIKGQEINMTNINKIILNTSFEAISLQKKSPEGNISSNFFSEYNLIRQQATREELSDWASSNNLIVPDTAAICKSVSIAALGRVPSMSIIFEDDMVRSYHTQEATLLPAFKYRFSPDNCEMFLKDSTDLYFDSQVAKNIRQDFDAEVKYRVLNDSVISLLQYMSMPPLGTFSKMIVRRISPKYDSLYVELPDMRSSSSLAAILVKTKNNKKIFTVNNIPYISNGDIVEGKKLRIRNIASTPTYAPNNATVVNKWRNGEYTATIKLSVDLDSAVYQIADSTMEKMVKNFVTIQAVDISGCKDAKSPVASGKTCVTVLGEAKYSVEKIMYEKQLLLNVNFNVVNAGNRLAIAIPFDFKFPKYVKNVYVESLTIDCNRELSAEEAASMQGSSGNEPGKPPMRIDVEWKTFTEGYTKIYWNGKYGFADSTGKITIQTKYDYVFNFSEGLAQVALNRRKFFIDYSGTEILSVNYDYTYGFSDGLALVKQNKKYGYISKQGVEIIPVKYDYAADFHDGLARVQLNKKYGFIDRTGTVVIPLKYDDLQNFSEGLSLASLNGKYGFIDKAGKEITSFKYGSFSSGIYGELAPVELDGRWGFINKAGKEVTAFKYQTGVYIYTKDFIPVRINDKWGFINTSGEEVIPCIYEDIWSFKNGVACVKNNGKWGFIDTTGKLLTPMQYDGAGFFNDKGFAEMSYDQKTVFINKSGIVMRTLKYSDMGAYREGLAAVKYNGRWGFISTNEEEIIVPKYEEAKVFSEGIAAVKLNGKWGFIDKEDKVIIPFMYEDVQSFTESLAEVKVGNKWGVVDRKNSIVLSPVYDAIYSSLSNSDRLDVKLNDKIIRIDRNGNQIKD